MRHPQIVVFERDGRLAEQLRPLANERRWPLRESRQVDACVKLLGAAPGVLIVRLGSDPVRELRLIDAIACQRSAVRIVAVGDAEEPILAGITWDLGVDFALFPPLPRELLPGVVAGLMPGAKS